MTDNNERCSRKGLKKSRSLMGVTLTLLLMTSILIYGSENMDSGFIYGKITMRSGKSYIGPIRWGKEEAFWFDLFNSTKEENEFVDFLSRSDLRKLRKKYSRERRGFNLLRIFKIFRDDRDDVVTHQFVCRFGDIRKMKFIGSKTVKLTFKDGEKLEVSGGSNDINTRINVFDEEYGELNLKWKRIRTIEFMTVPKELKNKFGQPLYGTVKTDYGTYKGYIQWDHQENLTTDKLDGEGEDGDMSIEFGRIRLIKKYRRGSKVILKSGIEYYLYGTNDVNDDNRGIVVNDFNLGKILINWDEFISVEFEKNPATPIPTYEDFIEPKRLSGQVKTKQGKAYSGRIAFDLDEGLDFELLDGEADDIEFHIPFRNIEKIVPRGRHYSKVTLKNGKVLELEDERDVNRKNDGVLVWDEDEKPVYILWNNIKEIKFN